jgi:hypothetical protein
VVRSFHALIVIFVTASLCVGCASSELPEAGADAALGDDGGAQQDLGVQDAGSDVVSVPDVRPPVDVGGDSEQCVPATCGELGACGTVDDGCGGSLECGNCPDVSEVTMSPQASQSMQVGDVLVFSAVATGNDGTETFCNFEWSSQDPTVARVDSTGEVTALAPGITDIKVACPGSSTRVRVYINDSGLSAALTDSAELAIWLRADLGLDFEGSVQVEAWEDISGNGFVVANDSFRAYPTRVNNVLNGKPVIRFGGTHELRSATHVALSQATVFAVVKNNEATHRGQILSNCTDGGNNQLRFDGSANEMFFYGTENDLSEIVTLGLPTTTEQVLSVVLTDSELSVFQNGQAQASVPVSTNGTWNLGQVGARCSSEKLHGDVAELMVYRGALGDAERGQVESYLMNRYGL